MGNHMRRQVLNLANIITLSRIALIPLFLFILLTRMPGGELWAAAVFVLGAVTDGVDGYVARRWNQVTVFGKLIDPLADKLLVAAALVALVELGALSTWVVLAILAREFAVTGLRAVAAADGVVVAAGRMGKLKTVLQIVAVVCALVARSRSLPVLGPLLPWLHPLLKQLATVLLPWALTLAVAVTLYSGAEYGWRYLRAALARG